MNIGDIVAITSEISGREYRVTKIGCGSDGSRVKLDKRGNECFSESSLTMIREIRPHKPTREEKYSAHVKAISISSTAYRLAGWIASRNGLLHVSTPPKDLDKVRDILDAHKVEFNLGTTLTESSEQTQGWSVSVVVDNPNISDDLTAVGIHATPYFETNKVSIQTKQFVLDFLLDSLRFRLGSAQDLSEIRSRVPEQFKSDFERGLIEQTI